MIGIDIGGANLKVVDETGAHIHYCPLWEKAPICNILSPYIHHQNAAVVMSGELADCFSSKAEGIAFIVSQVKEVFPHAMFYGNDGLFHHDATPELAAANWLAMADYMRDLYPEALLIDMGSTTTDIIPLGAFDAMIGQTDLTRLQQGFLIYCGLLRTNIATLIRTAQVNGLDTPVSTEYFASTADAYVALGMIKEEIFTSEPADRKGTDRVSCLRRLARVVCADLTEIGEEGALNIARSVVEAHKQITLDGIRKITGQYQSSSIIVSGIGSAIASSWVSGIDLESSLGICADALPAWAVRELGQRTHYSD